MRNSSHSLQNVGTTDRRARLILGAGLFVWAYFTQSIGHWVFLGLGITLFLTALMRFCPFWFGLEVNTHSPKGSTRKG